MRIVITRPRKDAEELAQEFLRLGFEPIILPTIEITPVQDNAQLDTAIKNLDSYDWLILTSVNGVNYFFARMQEIDVDALPTALKVAAIGEKTAASLNKRGVYPDFIPAEYVSEAIKPGLGEIIGKRFLYPTADIAADSLRQSLEEDGGMVDMLAIYQTSVAEPDQKSLMALRSGVDVITFTSASTVRNFVHVVEQAGLEAGSLPGNPLFACIGPKTAHHLHELGLPVDIMAKKYTTEGLIAAIQDHLNLVRKN